MNNANLCVNNTIHVTCLALVQGLVPLLRRAGGGQGAMPLVYAAVARGPALLCEYALFSGNFGSVAKDYLARAASAGRFTYTSDGHVFSFLAEDGYSAAQRRVPMKHA